MDDIKVVSLVNTEDCNEVLSIAESLCDVDWQALVVIGFNEADELCEAYTTSSPRDRLWLIEQYRQVLCEDV